jgi:hypothetical protein
MNCGRVEAAERGISTEIVTEVVNSRVLELLYCNQKLIDRYPSKIRS